MAQHPLIHFISTDLGAPTRYRVHHQIEQARLASFSAAHSELLALGRAPRLPLCDVLYLHRLPLTSRTLPLVLAARLRRISVVFDTDDLVWDANERSYNFLDDHYPPDEVRRILKTTRRMRMMMRLADALVFSTTYLAQQAARVFKQAGYVNQNAVSEAMLQRADKARASAVRPDGPIVIGYFSGQAKVHDEDVASVATALCDLLSRNPHVRLRVYGGLALRSGLEDGRYAAQIERREAVTWEQLPAQIAQVHINIAPLVDNPQRRSKSAIKYLEAALVGVPSVASSLEPYSTAIAHGKTGLLASSSEEWYAALEQLIGSTTMRQDIGAAARADVLANHTTLARARNFASIVGSVLR